MSVCGHSSIERSDSHTSLLPVIGKENITANVHLQSGEVTLAKTHSMKDMIEGPVNVKYHGYMLSK